MGFGNNIPMPGQPLGGGPADARVQIPGYEGSGVHQMNLAFSNLQNSVNNVIENKRKREALDLERQKYAEDRRQYDLTMKRLQEQDTITNQRADKKLEMDIAEEKRKQDKYEYDRQRQVKIDTASDQAIADMPHMSELMDKYETNTITAEEMAEMRRLQANYYIAAPDAMIKTNMARYTAMNDPEKRNERMLDFAMKITNKDGTKGDYRSELYDGLAKASTKQDIAILRKQTLPQLNARINTAIANGSITPAYGYKYIYEVSNAINTKEKHLADIDYELAKTNNQNQLAGYNVVKAENYGAGGGDKGQITSTQLSDGNYGVTIPNPQDPNNPIRLRMDTNNRIILANHEGTNITMVMAKGDPNADANGYVYYYGNSKIPKDAIRLDTTTNQVSWKGKSGKYSAPQDISTWKPTDVIAQQNTQGKITPVKQGNKGKDDLVSQIEAMRKEKQQGK